MRQSLLVLLVLSLLSGLFGCRENITEVGNPSDVNGVVMAGPIGKAHVLIYQLQEDGSLGKELGSATTAVDGTFTLPVTSAGPVAIFAKGGEYTDEATGVLTHNDPLQPLVAWLPSLETAQDISVTPLTTVAAMRGQALLSLGLKQAITKSVEEVEDLFDLKNISITKTHPHDLTNPHESFHPSSAATRYGAILAAISQSALDNQVPLEKTAQHIQNLARDFSDGVLDGKENAQDISFQDLPPPSNWVSSLKESLSHFLKGPKNKSKLSPEELS